MIRTFKYRVQLSDEAEAHCLNSLERCRILYNLALEQRLSIYKQSKKSISCYDQINQLPELKKAFPEFAKVDAQCLQNVLERLDRAFKAFFKRAKIGKAGFPRFKSKDRYSSFTLRQCSWKLEGRYLYLSKIGRLRLFLSRPVEGKIKTVTVKRSTTGKWFVSFCCDNIPAKIFPKTDQAIGIDVGIKHFAVDSEGKVVENPKSLKRSLAELRVKQRTLSRRHKGSHRRRIARLVVARLHEKIANQRKDFLHKTSNHYIRNYKYIAVEDLNISGMIKNHHLAQSISDASWNQFFTMLSYKAESAGRVLVKVDPRGTSQRCSGCGELVPKKLSERIHACPHCGLVLDRDENAARNIKTLGQSHQALTSVMLADVA